MKRFVLLFIVVSFLASCNEKVKMEVEEAEPVQEEAPKGELAFLLQHGGRLPEDVGFLTNHVVERRLANLMKDSFAVLSTKTAYSTPIAVEPTQGFVSAKYFNDKERQDLASMIIIDAANDVFWVYYYNDDQMVKFTDNPSTAMPATP